MTTTPAASRTAQPTPDSPAATVLIIDDDTMLATMLAHHIESMGHHVFIAHDLQDGFARLSTRPFDAVFLDVNLPDGDGLEALPTIRLTPSAPEVIVITGDSTMEGAERAIRSGAWDYIPKGAALPELALAVNRVIQYRTAKRCFSPERIDRTRIIGESEPVEQCLRTVAEAAATDTPVLITGETGTGKELFAEAIHRNSPRREGPFIIVDCAALPENLVHSALLGHEKGAFTGAERAQTGLVTQADGGTLFLDEIGELPPAMQKAFLRVVQEKRFRPVGARRELSSDFRLVAATNRDLDAMVTDDAFRQDLLYRIRGIVLELPPLRQRRDDIPRLLMHYLPETCRRHSVPIKGFAPEFLECLANYDWPGNVREFVQAVEQAITAATSEPVLIARHLPMPIRIHSARTTVSQQQIRPRPRTAPQDLPPIKTARDEAIARFEADYLHRLLRVTRGDTKAACEISGLSRSRLYALLKAHGLSTTV